MRDARKASLDLRLRELGRVGGAPQTRCTRIRELHFVEYPRTRGMNFKLTEQIQVGYVRSSNNIHAGAQALSVSQGRSILAMAVPKITPKDVSISLDGKVRIEGEQGRIMANLMVRQHDRVIESFRKAAPDLKARDIRIDSSGRVVIKNEKIKQIALAIVQDNSLSNIGKVLGGGHAKPQKPKPAGGPRPADVDVGCGDPRGGNDLDVFCIGDSGLDLVCGHSDFSDEDCQVDFFCADGGSA